MKPSEPNSVMAVDCPHCKTKQKIHVGALDEGASRANYQAVRCIRCDKHFKFACSGKVIAGPFPA